jgi:hypothetical protein
MDKITLPVKAYDYLKHTVKEHGRLLHITGMNEAVKKELLEDVSKMKSVLAEAKVIDNAEDNLVTGKSASA